MRNLIIINCSIKYLYVPWRWILLCVVFDEYIYLSDVTSSITYNSHIFMGVYKSLFYLLIIVWLYTVYVLYLHICAGACCIIPMHVMLYHDHYRLELHLHTQGHPCVAMTLGAPICGSDTRGTHLWKWHSGAHISGSDSRGTHLWQWHSGVPCSGSGIREYPSLAVTLGGTHLW